MDEAVASSMDGSIDTRHGQRPGTVYGRTYGVAHAPSTLAIDDAMASFMDEPMVPFMDDTMDTLHGIVHGRIHGGVHHAHPPCTTP